MLWIWYIGWMFSLAFCETEEGSNKWSNIFEYACVWPLKLGAELRRIHTRNYALRKGEGR